MGAPRAADAKAAREAEAANETNRRSRLDIYSRMKPLIKEFGGPWTTEETPS